MEKTFIVSNMKEGLQRIREELGDEAYIIKKEILGENDSMLQHFSGNKIKLTATDQSLDDIPKIKKKDISVNTNSTACFEKNDLVSNLYSQLDDIKNMLSCLSGKDNKDIESPEDVFEFGSKDLNNFYRRMVENDITEILAGKFIHGLSKTDVNVVPEEHLREQLSNLINFKDLDTEDNVYVFTGEAGSGKTSTISKLAITLKLRYNLNILNISFDTYKEAGFYQLDSHCKVVNIKSIKVHDSDELIKIVEENRKIYDLIFIDTPGFELDEEHSTSFIPTELKCKKILVLDSNGRYRELKEKVDFFEKIGFDGYSFTKIDETFSYGNIYNILSYNNKPLVCFAHGQEIPASLIKDKEKAIDIILKGLC